MWGALLVLSASYFVRQLLRWLGAYNAGTAPQRDGWILSCFFFLCCWLLSVALQQMNLVSARMGLRVRAAVATAVYRKSLTVSLTDKRGDALALVATDCAKLQDAVQSVNYLWSGVLEALAIFGVLIGFVGKSALPGLGLLLVLLPFQYFLGTLGAKLRKKTVAASDDRVSLMDGACSSKADKAMLCCAPCSLLALITSPPVFALPLLRHYESILASACCRDPPCGQDGQGLRMVRAEGCGSTAPSLACNVLSCQSNLNLSACRSFVVLSIASAGRTASPAWSRAPASGKLTSWPSRAWSRPSTWPPCSCCRR